MRDLTQEEINKVSGGRASGATLNLEFRTAQSPALPGPAVSGFYGLGPGAPAGRGDDAAARAMLSVPDKVRGNIRYIHR